MFRPTTISLHIFHESVVPSSSAVMLTVASRTRSVAAGWQGLTTEVQETSPSRVNMARKKPSDALTLQSTGETVDMPAVSHSVRRRVN